eukprot:12928446-Prorocentrum_lima.AAC.1
MQTWTISMRDAQGGLLWVESKEEQTLPAYKATRLEPYVKGSNHVTKGKWHNFDGARWHAVTPTK